MVAKALVVIVWCVTSLVHTLSNHATIHKKSNFDRFLVKDRRTHTRHDYIVQNELDNEPADDDEEPPALPDNVPALFVDYANMIRNDIILLDNSVETRKRGNVKVENHNHAIPEPSCNCEYTKEPIDLGEDYYPRYIETRQCSKGMCPTLYECHKSLYNVTILKRKTYSKEESLLDLPTELKHRWVSIKVPITISCICARDYIED